MEALQKELSNPSKAARLSSTVEDVDKVIEMLNAARAQVAESEYPRLPARVSFPVVFLLTVSVALDPHTASLTMAKLQNPIKEGFETVNQDLKDVSRSHRNLGKALDKVQYLPRHRPSERMRERETESANTHSLVVASEATPNRPRCDGRPPGAH